MLFQQRFHAGIADGSITLTFRAWKSPRARAGSIHRLGASGAMHILAVEAVTERSITAAQARSAGFADRAELLAVLRKTAGESSKIYRVKFRFSRAPDPRSARRADTSASALDEVAERLERMDARSARGPWTYTILELIAERPEVAASQLAPTLKRETRPFKADVRKLKELGLTVSHEVGYSLSPRGRALLRRQKR